MTTFSRSARTVAALVCTISALTFAGCAAHSSTAPATTPAATSTAAPSSSPSAAQQATPDSRAFTTIVNRSWALMLAHGMTQHVDSSDGHHLFVMSPAVTNAPHPGKDGALPAGYLFTSITGGPVVRAAHEDVPTRKTSTVSSMEDFVLTFAKKGLGTGTSTYHDNGDGSFTETSVDSGTLTYLVKNGLVSGFIGTSQTGGKITTKIEYSLDAQARAVIATTVK